MVSITAVTTNFQLSAYDGVTIDRQEGENFPGKVVQTQNVWSLR